MARAVRTEECRRIRDYRIEVQGPLVDRGQALLHLREATLLFLRKTGLPSLNGLGAGPRTGPFGLGQRLGGGAGLPEAAHSGGGPLVQLPKRRAAPVPGQGVGGHLVQEEAVVAHEEQGAAEAHQGLLKVLEGRDVKVVGRLVQHHQVRRAEHGLGQQQAIPLAAAESRGRAVLLVHGKPKAGEVDVGEDGAVAGVHHGSPVCQIVQDGPVALQFSPSLGDGGDRELRVPDHLAAAGFQFPQEQFQQGGLPAPVRSQQGDAHAALEAEIQASQQLGPVRIGKSDALGADQRVAAVATGGEGQTLADLQAGAVLHRILQVQHLLDAQLGLASASLGAPAEPGHFPAETVLHVLGEPGLAELAVGPLQQVVAVPALVAPEGPVLQFQHPRRHGVQQVAVVGDEEQGALVGLEPSLQPLHLVGIEVVRGLVQHQDVRFLEPGLGQGHPFPPAARQGLHFGIQIEQAPEGGGGLQSGREIPAPVIQEVLDVLQLVMHPAFGLSPGSMQAPVDFLMPGQQRGVVRQGGFERLADRGSGGEMGFLAQAGNALALGDHHLPRIGGFIAG